MNAAPEPPKIEVEEAVFEAAYAEDNCLKSLAEKAETYRAQWKLKQEDYARRVQLRMQQIVPLRIERRTLTHKIRSLNADITKMRALSKRGPVERLRTITANATARKRQIRAMILARAAREALRKAQRQHNVF